jgi:RNA polymerase sigma-70 factor (ECF subfamily)
MAAMSDEEFNELWERYFPKLFRYCQFRSASVEDAEDLAAETFSRLFAHGTMAESHVYPWLYRVATNLRIDRWRHAGQRAPLTELEDLACEDQQWPDPTVWQAVQKLKGPQQLVVYLRLIEDRSFAEIGVACGRSEVAAKMTYHRALARLGALLGEDYRE